MAKWKLFGGHIAPNCEYCSHNCTPEESPTCDAKKIMGENQKCSGFVYNPLLRKPQNLPPLKTFDTSEFKL